MKTPDPYLMEKFGTESIYRQKLAGGLPHGLNLMAADWNVGRGQADEDERTEHRRQAQLLNTQLRQARALLMAPVEEKLRHTHAPVILAARVPRGGWGPDLDAGSEGLDHYLGSPAPVSRVPVGMDEGMVRLASVAGRVFAHVDLNAVEYDFDKEAGIVGTLATAASNIGSGAKKGISNMVTRLGNRTADMGIRAQDAVARGIHKVDSGITNTLMKTTDSLSNFAGRVKQAPGNLKSRVENWSQNVGKRLESAGAGVKPPPPVKPTVAPAAKAPAPQNQAAYRQPAVPTPQGNAGAAPPAKAGVSAGSSGGQAQGPRNPPAAQQAQPSAPKGAVQPAGADGKPQGGWWGRTGLSNGAWNWKIPALVAGGLGAYGLYRGAKALSGMMTHEHSPDQYNEGGPMPAFGVNQFGVADRSSAMVG